MADQELISGLIETYRVLNINYRGLGEERLRATHNGSGSIRDILNRLRDDEMQFSQALKQCTTGVKTGTFASDKDRPVIGLAADQKRTSSMIAQFGTAREATLSILRDLPDAEWETDAGGKSIHTRVVDLLANDRRQLDRISQLLSA